MKLNRKDKIFVITALTSVSCTSFIMATAFSAQAHEVRGRSHRHAVAQRVKRPPTPEPEPRPPVRQPDNRQNARPEPSEVSLDVDIRI